MDENSLAGAPQSLEMQTEAVSQNVFTYGSLMFEPVWQRVVQGRYRRAPARLAGYGRFALLDDTYPGMVPALEPGQAVDGVLYFDVAPGDLAALDRFEGVEYARRTVAVDIASAGAVSPIHAQTYVFLALQRLSGQPWHPENFAMEHFLRSYCSSDTDEGQR